MKLTNLRDVNYQRNGVMGNGFYSLIASDENGDLFLITFETVNNSDDVIDIPTVRAVAIMRPKESWRGDEFGYCLNMVFKEKMVETNTKSIYDLIKLYQ